MDSALLQRQFDCKSIVAGRVIRGDATGATVEVIAVRVAGAR
jgi:hypothetical protein